MSTIYDSILQTVRSYCNLSPTDSTFDNQLLPMINSEMPQLARLGACQLGKTVSGETDKWSDFVQDNIIQAAADLVATSVFIRWDPPTASAAVTANNDAISKDEFVIQMAVEGWLT